jgi:hypothetical protein
MADDGDAAASVSAPLYPTVNEIEENDLAKNGGIPGLSQAVTRTERESPKIVLAEGEELWSNTLNVSFQSLRMTYIPMGLWGTAGSPRYQGSQFFATMRSLSLDRPTTGVPALSR